MKGLSITSIVLGGLCFLTAAGSTVNDYKAVAGWLLLISLWAIISGIIGVVKTNKK